MFPRNPQSRCSRPVAKFTMNADNWVDDNWVDEEEPSVVSPSTSIFSEPRHQQSNTTNTVVMVETAFLASAASLIWLINYYFPLGPLLKIFFPYLSL